MLTDEDIKQLWGSLTRTHQFTDGAFRVALARRIELLTARKCVSIIEALSAQMDNAELPIEAIKREYAL